MVMLRGKHLLFILLTLALCVIVFERGSYFGHKYRPDLEGASPQTQPTNHPIDGLRVTAEALHLGELWETRAHVCSLPIRNASDRPINVVDFHATCECSDINPRSFKLSPGETKIVQVKLDLSRRGEAEYGTPRRSFGYEIAPLLQRNRGPRDGPWKLHGWVNSRVTLDQPYLHFHEAPISGQQLDPVKVLATVHVPTQRLVVTVDPDVVSVQVTRRSGMSNEFELKIAPHPTLPIGPFKGRAQIDVVSPHRRAFGRNFTVPGRERAA